MKPTALLTRIMVFLVVLVLPALATAAALTITTDTLVAGMVNKAYSQTLTVSGGTPRYMWVISAGTLPAGLSLSSTGIISGTPTAAVIASSITIKVTDTSIPKGTVSKTLSLTTYPVGLVITTDTLPNGIVGSGYNQTLTQLGGTPRYTWSAPSGSLPTGLSLSSAGVISGTPSVAGTTNVTVKLIDTSIPKMTVYKSIALTIIPPPVSITIISDSLTAGAVGVAYNQSLTAISGASPYTWSVASGTLPAGLSLSSAGVISGTPTTAGVSSITLKATDAALIAVTKILSLTINPPPLTITTPTLANAMVGTSYSQTLAATGGKPNYSWVPITGRLPAGLVISGAGGISGIPTVAGTANMTFRVSDSSSPKGVATKALTLTVKPAPLTITTAALTTGTVGMSYGQNLTGTGGVSPYVWSAVGTLPAGLSLNSGTISGTPTTIGATTFTLQLTDSDVPPVVVTKSVSLTVNPPPLAITTASLTTGTVGAAYSQSLAATGGYSPYIWSVTGSLPAGLTLSGSVISGTPTAAGITSLTLNATDSAVPPTVVSKVLSLTINPPPLAITTVSLPAGTVGAGYSQTLAATGGVAPYSWSLVGSLPAGLSLNAGVISGVPSNPGTATITFRATDSAGTPVSATTTLSLTINPAPLNITTGSLASGTVGASYNQTLTATGGISPYGWSVTGTLPTGLALGSSGVISGTPSAAGTTNITITVTDSAGIPVAAATVFSLTINPAPLAITTASLAAGTVGASYSQSLASSGGINPCNWSMTGTLPAGLILSSAGVISGVPTAAGTTNITFQVADFSLPAGFTTKQLSIVINAAIITRTNVALQANGGVASASSTRNSDYPASGANDGDHIGLQYGNGGVWVDATENAYPDWLQVTFNGQKSISEIDLYTVQDDRENPVEPTETMTFEEFGNTKFSVQYRSGVNWITVDGGNVTDNNLVWRKFSFPAVTTDAVRVVINAAAGKRSRIVELEAYSLGGGATIPLAISTSSLAAGNVAATYSQTLVAAGGIKPYSWSISAGTLPAGMTISSAGLLSGSPTVAGTTDITFQVVDASSPPLSTTKQLSIIVNGAVSIRNNVALAANGGVATASSIKSSSYPATGVNNGEHIGLDYGAGGVWVDGTSNKYPDWVQVAFNGRKSISEIDVYTVQDNITHPEEPTASMTFGDFGNTRFNVQYRSESGWVTVNGGSVNDNNLVWRKFSFPPVTTDAIRVVVLEAAEESSRIVEIEAYTTDIVTPNPLTITTATLVAGTVGMNYSQTLAAGGGTAPYTWGVAAGTLPAGLTLNSAGVISGAPTTAANAIIVTFQATDFSAVTVAKALSLTVNNAPLTFTTATLASGSVGASYSQTLIANGGTAPYTWVVTAGTLPAGLTLTNAGVISGVPTGAVNAAGITFQVTDASSPAVTITKALSLTVTTVPITITTATLAAGTIGASYNQALTATGGTTPYTWTVTAGALPAGLTLAGAGVITGIPTAAANAVGVTFQATDSSTPAITTTRSLAFTITGVLAVPNGVGLALAAARTTLEAAGFAIGNITAQQSATVPTGSIISQTPAAGISANSGSTVDLVVSLGVLGSTITVPKVIGQTESAATAALTTAGLNVGAIAVQESTVAAGVVIGQSQSAGSTVPSGTIVALITSSGPSNAPIVPPVITPLPTVETTPPAGSGLSKTAAAPYVVLAWNDLGMHCLNPSYDTAVILPPYNTVQAQVIKRGNKPTLVTTGVTLSYRLINNTTSQKNLYTQFWQYASSLFGGTPTLDFGLNLDDPTISNGLTGNMLAKSDHFVASGIPATPVNDGGTWTPYQMIEITVKDSATNATLAQTRATVPTSDEINCGKCHGNSSNPSVVLNDVLAKHDASQNTTLLFSKPVLCSSCHGSPALKMPLQPGIKYLSEAIHGFHGKLATPPNCYDCHPGAVTQCTRSTKHTAPDGNCTACHGDMSTVASTVATGARVPWASEPKCVNCHITGATGAGVAQVDTGTTLYRNTSGHGGLYCSACHGSPHAMVPSNQVTDNYQSLQYQGKAMPLGDCRICHNTSRGGGSASGFSSEHGGSSHSACNVCHTGYQNAAATANWPHQFQWKSR